MSPTTRTAGLVAAIALAAIVVPPEIGLLALAALAGAVAVDAMFARRRPDLQRAAPELLSRGVPGQLELHCSGAKAGRLDLRQASPPALHLEPERGGEPLRAQILARRRGRHRLPPVAARATGPLGLASWDHDCAGEHEVRVFPDLPASRRIAEAARNSRFRDPGSHGRGPLGLGTEFELIRRYSPDDDIRQVNWLATARLGEPMSNEYRLEQDRDVIALLDAGRLMRAPIAGRTRLDAAMDALAALAAVADDIGDRFGVLVFDDQIRSWFQPRRRNGRLAVNRLFDLEPTDTDSDYLRAFRHVEGAKRAFVIVFTDILEEFAARSLLAAVPVLAKRHALVVAGTADTEIGALATREPVVPLDVYRASVAGEVLESRARVDATLTRAGAEVLEAPASELAASCVRAYLRAKARARV